MNRLALLLGSGAWFAAAYLAYLNHHPGWAIVMLIFYAAVVLDEFT